MPLENWIQHSRVNEFLYDWQTLIAGLVALLAAFIAVGVPEWRARTALRASLAGEIRLYVELLTDARDRLVSGKKAFLSGASPDRDFDWAVLPPPVVYPAAADRLGHVGRPSAADVVNFYANVERANFTVRVMSNEPTEKVSANTYSTLIAVFESAYRESLPLLSELPSDERDADFRAKVAEWDAERAERP
jgi:hypothetical protein